MSRRPFFERVDWLSFAVSTAIALGLYLYTLSPEVTLESSGVYATGAMYGSGGPPAGFPAWSIYAWLFTKILPFSNIARRIAVSSAVAGALTCGVIALMVSRGSAMLLARTRGFRRLMPRQESQLRLVCGAVAGLGFGFHGTFWRLSVIVEPAPLGLLLMSVVLCLLLRWGWAPAQTRCLYAAAFVYGLTLTTDPSLAALAPALPFFVLFFKRSIGRDLMLFTAVTLGAVLLAFKTDFLPEIVERAGQFGELWPTYLTLAIAYAIVSLLLTIRSRQIFTRWRSALLVVALSFCGLSFYFYLALASMTNPPVNWGYARTSEGFVHMISRGQFERMNPVNPIKQPGRYFGIMWRYGSQTIRIAGWPYLLASLFPLIFVYKIRGRARRWMLGLLMSFLFLSFFMLIFLNPGPDTQAWSMLMLYFSPAHLILLIWAGYGLALFGTFVGRNSAASHSNAASSRSLNC